MKRVKTYHVKPNHRLALGRLVARPRIAHNTTRRPGQDSTQAAELLVADKTAVGLHKLDARLVGGRVPGLEPLQEAVDVAPRLGRQVRVGRGRVRAVDELDDGEEGVRQGHAIEADGGGQLADALLVLLEVVAVDQAHGDAAEAVGVQVLELAGDGGLV